MSPPTWAPISTIVENWGRPRLIIGGSDVTYFRGHAAQIGQWTSNEPFDDATATFKFPQISPFEALPSWLSDYANVDLEVVHPNGSIEKLWEGLFISEKDATSEREGGLIIECVGALYQTDFYRKLPEMFRYGNGEDDIMILIQKEFDPTLRPALRTQPLMVPGWTGVTYDQIGSFQPSLTGYVSELLGFATSSGMPLPGESITGIVMKPDGSGYWLVGSMGSVLAFGEARYYGSMVGTILTEPTTGIAPAPDGEGYWFGAEDGGVFTFGFGIGFQGSLGATPMDLKIEAIDAMPTGQGYVLIREDGSVYAFGNAPYLGGTGALTAFDKAVDISLTPSGAGYTIVTHFGYVYTQGDAAYHGGVNSNLIRIVGIAVRPQGDGYWLLRDDGYVYAYGAGATGTLPNFAVGVSIKASDITVTPTGLGLLIVDQTGNVFAYGDADDLGDVNDGGGSVNQWTVMKNPGRQPILRVKNMWDVQWTVTLGTPGVAHDLNRDLLMSPNTYYGSGIDPEGCTWRNSKYPGQNADATPAYPGEVTLGTASASVLAWERQMEAAGWGVTPDGVYTRADANIARAFQEAAGLAQTGTINAQTWAATWQIGSNANDLKGAYIYPIAMRGEVDPFLYNPKGDVIGANAGFNRNVARVETYDMYGSRVTKYEGAVSAEGRLRRDNPAQYMGTITLGIDPEEGSRFMMKAGQNILVKSHRGANRQFHISQVDVNWEQQTVTLQVDVAGKDALTLAAFRDRYRETTDPTQRPRPQYRNSRQTEDRKVTWDCESGAGIVPRHAINAGLWNVLRIPCGESGDIISTEFTVETPARFSLGVFDKAVTHSMLINVGSSPLNNEYWDDDFWNDWGLIMAYGGEGQAGGFYPGLESDGDSMTGRLVDDASWHFQSRQPPWLWIAMWVESPSTNYISGRLLPGILA